MTTTATATNAVTETIHEVVVTPSGVEVRAVSAPRPARGQAVIRMIAVGVCGSDVHAAHGRHPFIQLPYRPGHEIVGVVDAVGEDVSIALGTRVVIDPVHSCGDCKYCRDGRTNLCTTASFFGCSTPNGGLADRFVILEDQLIPLPEALEDLQAVLVEPLATPVHAVRLAGPDLTGKSVAILGAGTIGLLTLAVVRRAGAQRVAVTDISADKRQLALALGADSVFDPSDTDVGDAIKADLGVSADVVFDCVSVQSTVSQAIELAIKGGTVVTVGVPATPVVVPLPQLQDLQVRLQGSATFIRDDLLESIAIISEGHVRAEDLVTARFGLGEASAAFEQAASGHQVKVVILADLDRPSV